MYVSLDMQNMKIVHKHSSVNAVCGLVHIELPDVAVNVCPIDMTVKHKTDLEIKMLFRSCFPGQADHMPVSEMKSKILQFAEEFPVTIWTSLRSSARQIVFGTATRRPTSM